MPQIFKARCIVNFRKHKSRKQFRSSGVKIVKST